jgi:DNA primase
MAQQQTVNQKIRPLRYIRKNFAWRDYVEAHYQVKYAGDAELRVNCPSCGDHKHKCYVNVDKKVFHCFKCTFTTRKGKYDVFDFVALTEGVSKGVAVTNLLREYKPVTPEDFEAALAGEMDVVPEQPKKFKHPYLEAMPKVAVRFTGNAVQKDCLPFLNYLKERGITSQEMVDVMQTYYVPDKSHEVFGHNGKRKGDIGRRILWPIYGGDNKLVSWQARCFENTDDVKYFNAPDTDISATLWPYVPPRPGTIVVLCEGIIDCVALRRLGPEFAAYATFSKHISEAQIQLLKDWGVENVILFWDQEAKYEIKGALKNLDTSFNMFVPNCLDWPEELDDPGDTLCGEDAFHHLQFAVDNAIKYNTLDYVKWELA